MKSFLKKIIPVRVVSRYHQGLAILAKLIYQNPSEKLIVVGVTGTNGKSSTVWLTAKIFEAAGQPVGAASTILFKVAGREWLNAEKMTMLGRLALQKLLRQMVKAGCRYAVIETSSEGIKQFRHLGVNYDLAVFTNLTPEHLEAHGGFLNYQKTKEKLFAKLSQDPKKNLFGKLIKKTIIANADDSKSRDFLKYQADQKYLFSLKEDFSADGRLIVGRRLDFRPEGISFQVGEERFNLKLFGEFNAYNCLAAIAVAQARGIELAVCRRALEKVSVIPGRMEFIKAGQNFQVIVDYAPEPVSLNHLYQAIRRHHLAKEGKKIIHLLGSCGGGRDRARRPVLGRLAAENADYLVIANEDPYDDDPKEIINEVAGGALKAGKKLNNNLFKITDRRKAMEKAFSLAEKDDLVLLTGKGCEQAICLAKGKKIPWDERQEAKKALNKDK